MLTDFRFDEPSANAELCCLKVLDLSANKLSIIPKRSVSNLPTSLVNLDLSSNAIMGIESGAFEDMINLKSLSLSWNDFETLDLNKILNRHTANIRFLCINGSDYKNILWQDYLQEEEVNTIKKRKRSEEVSKFPVKCLRDRVLVHVNESQNNLSHEVLNKLVDDSIIRIDNLL
jgi:Leucine-rich repeat (LRR) protein